MAGTPIDKLVQTIRTVDLLAETIGKHETALIRLTDALDKLEARVSRLEQRGAPPPAGGKARA